MEFCCYVLSIWCSSLFFIMKLKWFELMTYKKTEVKCWKGRYIESIPKLARGKNLKRTTILQIWHGQWDCPTNITNEETKAKKCKKPCNASKINICKTTIKFKKHQFIQAKKLLTLTLCCGPPKRPHIFKNTTLQASYTSHVPCVCPLSQQHTAQQSTSSL